MSRKIRLAIVFGGRSCEHEVSVTSARSMLDAMDRSRYEITLVGIDKSGRWLSAPQPALLDDTFAAGAVSHESNAALEPVALGGLQTSGSDQSSAALDVDVVFPLLHGPYGEDGTVQGMLELVDIAYVGSGVLGSAVSMDKAMCKRVLDAYGISQTPWRLIERTRWREERAAVLAELGAALSASTFIKPANLGSSVGVSRADDAAALATAIDHAAEFDTRIIVESAVNEMREIECAVLGNERPEASLPGEILPADTFYSYSDKYLDGQSQTEIPATLSDDQTEQVRDLAIRVFKAVDAAGLARVDLFVPREPGGEILVNEINTMPGFTPISMYPKLWEASGLSYPDLIDRLVDLAIERQRVRSGLRQSL